jgi:hypothetical protein
MKRDLVARGITRGDMCSRKIDGDRVRATVTEAVLDHRPRGRWTVDEREREIETWQCDMRSWERPRGVGKRARTITTSGGWDRRRY